MKKLDNKGFTLIELLAVVVILLAISVIAISSISSAIERTQNKQDNAKIEVLKTVGKLYFDEHKNNNDGCVQLAELELSEDELTKSNGDKFGGSIKYDIDNNKYLYCDESTDCSGSCS